MQMMILSLNFKIVYNQRLTWACIIIHLVTNFPAGKVQNNRIASLLKTHSAELFLIRVFLMLLDEWMLNFLQLWWPSWICKQNEKHQVYKSILAKWHAFAVLHTLNWPVTRYFFVTRRAGYLTRNLPGSPVLTRKYRNCVSI